MHELGIARRDELPQLVALLTILFSEESEFSPDYEKQTRALEKILADQSVGTIYVARDEGQVVAMAAPWRCSKTWSSSPRIATRGSPPRWRDSRSPRRRAAGYCASRS